MAGTVVVTAPPGAGKTTRVPLALLDAPWRNGGRIVVLEPRRVAARAAAARMAEQLGESVGERVGLSTREDRRVSDRTIVEVVTEGTLVRRLQRDPELPGVAAVLLDEFHERSLDADLALALCLEARDVLRPDLRIGVLSATIDAPAVADLVGPGTPVVASLGRAFPVTVEHVAASPLSAARPHEVGQVVADAVRDVLTAHEGDVLVFLPGVAEIDRTAGGLGGLGVEVVRLHGGLPAREQDRALRPGNGRRVVLSTDLAESSVTVPGVRIVVDAGLAREPRLDARTGMTRLVTVPASRASADQRAGRAGRVAPGHAVRLWPAASHAGRPAWPVPESAQGDLAGFLLTVAAFGTTVDELRLLDAPPAPSLAEARTTLRALGALDEADRITDHGRVLASLPLHPRLGHLVASAAAWGVTRLGVDVAALLAERDVVGRNRSRPDADLVTRLRVLRGTDRRQDVREGALAAVRREAKRLQRVASRLPVVAGNDVDVSGLDEEDLVGALVAHAWPDRVGRLRSNAAADRGRFLLAGGRGAVLDAGDPLAAEEWIAVADVDAGRVDARVHRAAAIPPEVVARVLGSLVTREERVRWDEDRGDVEAVDEERLGAIVLVTRPLDLRGRDVRPALVEGLRLRGLDLLPWSERGQSLRERLTFLHGALGEPWPDTGDDALLEHLDDWLLPFVPNGARRLADLRKVDTTTALLTMVPHDRVRRIDDLAPTHLTVPSGSRIRLDWETGEPVLAVKLQELFGLEDTPRVADGRVPVLVHLLSPAQRPLAVTRDLAGFWDGAYQQVRSEMRGRYPKHAWPEDPRSVEAHRGTKNKQRRG